MLNFSVAYVNSYCHSCVDKSFIVGDQSVIHEAPEIDDLMFWIAPHVKVMPLYEIRKVFVHSMRQ